MRRRGIITHGPCRPWRALWAKACRCGLAAWPCPALVMLERQAADRPALRNKARPAWDDVTRNLSPLPLLTRGQEARSRQNGRW
jgi:hypothetical protein